MDFESDKSLKEWCKDKPLSILQLDPADRAVLRIAEMSGNIEIDNSWLEEEEAGSQFKGVWQHFVETRDERDAIQKKTFTKWVNKHLKKANRHVNDLFTDLQDGLNLICLLEVLSGEHLPREKGRMRFHMLQNVELVLNFLRYKKIKLVNIRPEDIVDGNPKLTLGLIWTIILHFQISDIVVGEEPNVSARDVLLRWARKSANKYPGVKVSDFTSSWRDGLAFNAILHRNRPDLLPEWREIRRRNVRERLETAFYTAEKVGVTRLLDPEDVDTHEIDEKSIITYISSLYDAFPEPPSSHPLYDNEGADLTREYREVASSLHMWLRQKLAEFGPRDWGHYSMDELKRAASESNKFVSHEIPQRMSEKQKLQSLYRDLQKIYETTGEVDIEPELHIDVLDRNWSKLMTLHQKHDLAIQDELKKWDRSGRLAEKVLRECKRLEPRLDDLDSRISSESSRIERLHPLDGKHVCDSIEAELRTLDDSIQSLGQDVSTLKAAGHPQAADLNKRVTRLHQRWVQLRSALHAKLISRLASMSFPVVEERTVTRETRTILETRLVDTNHHFRQLQEAIDWLKAKLKHLQEAEFSSDLSKAKLEMSQHQRDHREIERFETTVNHCVQAKSEFSGEELALYSQHLSTLQRLYAELLALSNKRLSEFETLLDFLQSVASQLAHLKEKESVEVARDWSDPNMNLPPVQAYYENSMMELERLENVVRSLLERGESLLLQGHPASKAISTVLGELQSSWSRVLQYTLALETHIATTLNSQAFYRDLNALKDWIHSRDEVLNTTYSASEFSLDEGERLLRGMQELREELNSRTEAINELATRANSVAPLRQRRQPVVRPIQLQAVCDYKSTQVEIEKGDQWTLHDNSALTKWRVSPIGSTKDTNVPGVVFLIPPPSKEARDAVEALAKDFERTLSLWQRKQLRLRQNMIFTTIRVVRSWDLNQFVAMGADQRNAIRKALNEDADKLLAEGDPNDPQLRRLRREMAEVNRLFDEFEALANQQEENKNAIRTIMEKSSRLQEELDEAERTLTSRLTASIPRDVHSLEHLVVQHKEFETSLKNLTPEIESLQASFNNLTRKTPGVQTRVEGILQQWNQIWNYSHLYVERLKCVEITLGALEEATNVVSDLEIKLASFGEMPSELQPLQNVHDDLIRLQNEIAGHQPIVDQLIEDARNTRKLVVKSREKLRTRDHPDLDRLDTDVNSVTQRWNNLCASLVDRLRCCEAAYSLLNSYGQTYQTEIKFIDESYTELNSLPPVSTGKPIVEPTKVLFTSIVERTQPLEQVNIDGGRFIREAKIYNLACEKFRSWVSSHQPSYDTDEPSLKGNPGGEELVTQQLDVLNQRFLALVSILQDRLRQIAATSDDADFQEFVSNLKPLHLKTFRTEFTLSETATQLSNRWRPEDTVDMGLNGSLPKTGIGTPVTQKKGIFDPKTKNELTIEEAIKNRILDVRNGLLNLPDGSSVPILAGVALGIVRKGLADELLGPSNIAGCKNLLEAIQKELHFAEGSKYMVNLTDSLDLKLFYNDKFLDRENNELISLYNAPISDIKEILHQNKKITFSHAKSLNLSLNNLPELRKNLIIQKPFSFKDFFENEEKIQKIFGSNLNFSKCLELGILDFDNLKCVLDSKNNNLITLREAINCNIVTKSWEFYDTKNNRILSLKNAVENGYICSVKISSIFDVPIFKHFETNEFVSYNEANDYGLFQNFEFQIKKSGKTQNFKDALNNGFIKKEFWETLNSKIGIMSGGKELSILTAALKSYIDPQTGLILDRCKVKIGYKNALERKIITENGLRTLRSALLVTYNEFFSPNKPKKSLENVKKIFDTLAMRSITKTGLTLQSALENNFLNPETGLFQIPGTDRQVTFEECLRLGIIDHNSAKFTDGKKSLSLIRALDKKILNKFGGFSNQNLLENIQKGFIVYENFSEPIEVCQNVFLEPNSEFLVFADSRRPLKITEAISELNTKIYDPDLNEVDLGTAQGTLIVNNTYDPNGLNLSLVDAVQKGYITFENVQKPILDPGKESKLSSDLNFEQVSEISPMLTEIIEISSPSIDILSEKTQNLGSCLTTEQISKTDTKIGFLSSNLNEKADNLGSDNISKNQNVEVKSNLEKISPVNISQDQNILTGKTGNQNFVSKTLTQNPDHSTDAIDNKKMDFSKELESMDNFEFENLPESREVSAVTIENKSLGDKMKKVGLGLASLAAIPFVVLNKTTSQQDLALKGIFDPKKGHFISPQTGQKAKFSEILPYLDPQTMVKDTQSGEFIPISEASFTEDGELTDYNTGRKVPLFTALKLNWLQSKQNVGKPKYTLEYSIEHNILDRNGIVSYKNTKISLSDAIKNFILDPNKISIIVNDDLVPLMDAIESNLIDLNKDDLSLKFKKGEIRPQKPALSLEAVISSQNSHRGIIDPITGQNITVDESIKRFIVNPNISYCKDTLKNEIIELPLAIDRAIIKNRFKDTKNHSKLDLIDAVRKELIFTPKNKISLRDALTYYENGKFLNPYTGEILTLNESLNTFIDGDLTLFKDVKSNNFLTTDEALKNKLLDGETGFLNFPYKMGLDLADRKGIIVVTKPPMTLSEAISQNLVDQDNKIFLNEQKLTLGEALSKNLILNTPIILKSGQLINLEDAIQKKFVEPNLGQICGLDLKDAFDSGILAEKCYDVDEGVQKIYNTNENMFVNPENCSQLSPKRALDKKVLDQSQILVQENFDSLKTFEESLNPDFNVGQALNEGKIIKIQRPVPFYDALNTFYDRISGLFMNPESGEYVTLENAVKIGLIDPNSVVNLKNGSQIPLLSALADNLTEQIIQKPVSLQKYLKNTKNIEFPVQKLISERIIDDTKILCFTSKPVNLREAMHSGILVGNEFLNLNLHEALNQNLILNLDGPFSLYDIVKFGFINENNKIIHPETNKILNIKEALNIGLIDPEKSVFRINENAVQNLNNVTEINVENNEVLNHDLKTCKNVGILVPYSNMDLEEALNSDLIIQNKILAPKLNKIIDFKSAIDLRVIDPQTTVFEYNGQNFSLNEIIQNGFFDTNNMIINVNKGLTLKEAFDKNILYTVPKIRTKITFGELIFKDFKNKKLLKFSEAKKNGYIDINGRILNTQNSKLLNFDQAIKENLISSKISLIEALNFGIYNPITGLFLDPFSPNRQYMTLDDCLKTFIDSESNYIRTDDEILDFDKAINLGILDLVSGRLRINGTDYDFIKAHEKGYFIDKIKREAMEEKYKLCDDNLRSLLDWLSEIEARVTNLEPASEDLEVLKNQIGFLRLVKEELESQSRQVGDCLDNARNIINTGHEYLTEIELKNLDRNSKSLRVRYDRANDKTDKLLKKITNAGDNLSKFKSETKSLTDWMHEAEIKIDEKEKNIGNLKENDSSVRDLLGEVIARQADLRFISMAANKFYDESKDFLSILNEFRTSVSSRLPHIDLSLSGSEIKNIVNRTSTDYRRLLARVNALSDRVSGLNARLRDFQQAFQRFSQWMASAEPRATKVCGEAMAADPHGLEEQLSRAKNLNNEFLAQGRLIDNLRQALELLPSDAGKSATPEVQELTGRYTSHCSALSSRVRSLEAALSQSQGVESSLDSLSLWLNQAEATLKQVSRPVSLSKERLEDHIRELRLLLSDVETHSDSVQKTADQARALISAQAGSRLATRVDAKLRDVLSRFEKLSERSSKRSELVGEIGAALTAFSASASEVEIWLQDAIEVLASNSSIENLVQEREKKHHQIETVLRDGRALISKKDVTDTGHVRDRIKNIESGWREILSLLEERDRLMKSRAETTQTYEKLKDQVLGWLQSMESRIAGLEPIALHSEVLQRQINEIKPLIKEHKEYGSTVEKLFDVGSSLESAVRADSPRRLSSPVKRLSSSQLLRRSSQEGTVSPSRLFSVSSPVGGRRSSQEIYTLQEVMGISSEVEEIARRYSQIGSKLSDRQNSLDLTRDELRRVLDSLKGLETFLERVLKATPREGLPSGREEADNILKVLKGILEEMYEKQSFLESAKSAVSELVRKRGETAPGAEQLRGQVRSVSEKWKHLHDTLKARLQFLEDAKEVFDSYDLLSSWLSAKERMFAALGPISPDPRMVQVQIEQVVVLKEEMRATKPQLDHLVEVTARVTASSTPDSQKLRKKVESITNRWQDLARKLEERLESLGAAVDSSKSFDQGLSRLRNALSTISSEVDNITNEKPNEALRKIQGCERQLEGVRSLLADAESAGAQLAAVLTDPASKSDIQSKLADVRKQYSQLQAKLDQRKAEIEALLRDGREVEASVAKTLGWVSGTLANLPGQLLVSADRDVLQNQLLQHQPIYKEVLGKEHEVILLLEKVSGRKDAETLRHDWERLRREATERMTRLQTSMEHCKKYYKSLENFIPWLSQAENKLEVLSPDSFSRRDLDKHLRDLGNIRNDVWKKSGEFEHVRSLCETFVSSCDIDKEIVAKELAAVKERWDALNNDLLKRISRLEELRSRLSDASEKLRHIGHEIQRCEDRLTSHDSISATPDSATLVKLKALRDDVNALRSPLSALTKTVEDLDREVEIESRGRTSGLMEEIVGLGERLDDLSDRLRDRCSVAESAAIQAHNYNEKVKILTADLASLEAELNAMKPPARELKLVLAQIDQLAQFTKKVSRVSDEISDASLAAERLMDSGVAIESTRKASEALRSQLVSIEERIRSREEDLRKTETALREFLSLYDEASHSLDLCENEISRLRTIGSDANTLRVQQNEARKLIEEILEPTGKIIDQTTDKGRNLINTAAPTVSTNAISQSLENLRNRWENLNTKMVEREQKLNSALLQSGKFKEALEGLEKWLTDTEDMVNNQRPPAADYNVVKAQLQEQKFLIKMITDREDSLVSLERLGREMPPSDGSPQLAKIRTRFDVLSSGATSRMSDLERTLQAAQRMQEKLSPLVEWLEKSERKIRDMELVPTDEEKIQQRIREHNGLHSEILRKKPDFSELTDLASDLMSLVGDEEAGIVADKVQDMAERYTSLVDASDNIGRLLESSRSGLRHLVLTYQGLQAWMEGMEERLGRHRILPVHTDRLLAQMDELADLTEEISRRQTDVDSTVESGLELMKHISADEAIQLKEKLDSLQRRYNALVARGADLLKQFQEGLPLVEQFHNSHTKLVDWMQGAETVLQSGEPSEESIATLEQDIQEFRPIVENINQLGGQLCTLSRGEGAATVEGMVARDNRRFESIVEQVQRKAERIHMGRIRAREVLGDLDSLLEWFKESEASLREADPPSSESDIIRLQLKEGRALADDVATQRGRVRDLLQTAKKILREATNNNEDTSLMRDKINDLRETVETVWTLICDRLANLERALNLSEHLKDSHNHLITWLSEMDNSVKNLPPPSIRPDIIAQQQDRTEILIQSLSEHKPLLEKLNKTGETLKEIVNDEDSLKISELLESDNSRYENLRKILRERQNLLEKALQDSSRASDKLEGMLRALNSASDEFNNLGPVSSQPKRIREQISELNSLSDQLKRREDAFSAVKVAAHDVIAKAPSKNDPAVKDIVKKLEKLEGLWNELQSATSNRGNSLQRALEVASEFWNELENVMGTLADLEASLANQQPPAARPQQILKQQEVLKEIKAEIDSTKPDVDTVRKSGQRLMGLVGETERPEVKKQIEELDSAWDTVTAAFARREENLIHAMERAMEFHSALEDISRLLAQAEKRFASLGPIGADIKTVKRQIEELKDFKAEVDPHMVKVEALNRQAGDLSERTSAEESQALRAPLASINSRWDTLNKGMSERSRQLEQSLLRLGQFQHALQELIQWIGATEKTLDEEIRPTIGDPHLLEVQLAKLKVLVNDIQAHQNSVDTLNDAGRQLVETGSVEALPTQEKLNLLNRRWDELLGKVASRRSELEEALRDAQRFSGEVADTLGWLAEVDSAIASSKPGGGLPETAQDQLDRFMEIYNEIEANRPKVEALLTQGAEYLKRAEGSGSQALAGNLKALKQRWESVQSRANDKKIKLEIALKEATEFHNQLQSFVDWLTSAEKTLSNLKPVSRVLETILSQIEEHKAFQKEIGVKRETMLQLDKKGTHLKYFSQKQDVILIKNLLISVQHRWERVVSKSAERTRALDHGYKEAKEFHDMWSSLMSWLTETDKKLDEIKEEISVAGQDPVKLKQRLAKHKETQKAIAAKQGAYDTTMRAGKVLRERAPKTDEPKLKLAINQLRDLWTLVSQKAVSGQRSLEEALLFCGQLKEAVESLLDWLKKTERHLTSETKIHGDLDTVQGLMDKHKNLEEELKNRSGQVASLEKSAREIPDGDAGVLRQQIRELSSLWDRVTLLAEDRGRALLSALKQAEELHKSVHMLLEWLSDAEMRLRFVENLPDDEAETMIQISEHEKFMQEMSEKEIDKNKTLALAERILGMAHPDGVQVIKHWITIIQSRWEEVTSWAKQRSERLQNHLASLRSIDSALEELLSWVTSRENKLRDADSKELPNTVIETTHLIEEHDHFMEETMLRENEVNTVFRAKQIKERKQSGKKSRDELRQSNQELNEIHRRQSRASTTPDDPSQKIGPKFAPKGNKTLEPQFKCTRSRLLYEKWRSLWENSWSRSRKLREHLAHLQELERLANFSWDQWRRRFLKFMNHKKSRLTDLFRKMDKNNDGLIPRDDFVNGIINTKFDTSKLEMGAVADMFDHNSEGYIDWKEFIAALRPDWVETKPPTEAEKIHDEVKRLVMLCTCRQKFRVFQVGEGKYRFGDSQKLRLVRILRSTVMVRVGGGWVALEEFLVKNDPCRAKGRTNIELREQFILADGVSQSMSAFKPKTSKSPGPITKIREKSERSVPMSGSSTTGRRSTEPGRTPTRSSTPGSAPGSRPASRPLSRHSSTLSLPTSDDGSTPSRIPRLSAKSKTSTVSNGSASGTRSPAGAGSRTPSGTKTPTSRRESFKL